VRVVVVGCGTAGAAAALLLHRAGHDVEVRERFAEPRPVGAGLLLQPTGLAVLAELGLLDDVLAAGSRVERLHGVTSRGRTVLDMRYDALAPGLAGLGIHRADLFGALHGALLADRVPLRTGTPVERLADVDADLVVVASGAASALRADLPVRQRATRYPWGALWAVAPDPENRFAGRLWQVYRGTRETLGFLPTGAGRVSVFWSVPLAAPHATLATLRAHADRHGIELPEELLLAEYRDVRMRAWHHGRAVVLGDAAHATSPQLGQGANLALVDALTLARALEHHGDDVPRALAAYDAERRAHVRFYQLASRAMTPFFQSHADALGHLRDAVFGPGARVPWLRRQMLLTLAGLKTGPLTNHPLGWPGPGNERGPGAHAGPSGPLR
jgi:2-polyprenyl-6-methoxyphenol hydroxylase-like FAD-dependent oxidoreductase